jgi:hypothetical protein
MGIKTATTTRAAKVAALLCAGMLWGACSSEGGSIGASCTTQQDCASLTVGNEVALCLSGACTRGCNANADCGCGAGTKPDDGSCGFACIEPSGWTSSICAKTCANNTDCNGTETCRAIHSSVTQQPLGYSTCLP